MSAVVSKGCQLLLSDARGVYIPRDFAEGFDLTAWHIDFDVSALANSESDLYWDTWERVLNNAYLIEGEYRFTLWQDGDLWAICPDLMTELEKLHFFWRSIMRCPLIYWHDLSESEKSDFEGMEDESFFRFGEFTFALSEFIRVEDFGIYNFNAFHGVKITVSPDGDAVNAEFIESF